ncbi:hypothetical protein MKEN_01371200 [Mycena kentingensis (nom. inval.)]|nr:hypothetical protein MKEN_01371200 [Mycena kentingensis (nom. inval.)]
MAQSPPVTPFIPPLNTPSPGPTPGQHPPVVPQAPTGPNPGYPAWAATPQSAGGYPAFGGVPPPTIYPNTPYNPSAGTPFIPGGGASLPPAGTPYPYFPATGPPGAARPLPPVDGGAYPPFIPPMMQSPWAPATPFGGPGTPWAHPGTAAAGYPSPYAPAGHPMMGGPPQGGMPMGGGPPSFARPMMYGGPGTGLGLGTPFAPAAPMGDPWGAGVGAGAPPWAAAMGMGMGMGMGGNPMFNPMAGMGVAGSGLGFGPSAYGMPEQQPMARAMGQGADRVGDFVEGPHYGPVLQPFLIRAVKAHMRLNPLLGPADTSSTTAPYLKWNMLWPANQCVRSDDPPHVSWSKGRNEPATFPRTTYLRLVSATVPWSINVYATNQDVGVTCGNVLDAISSTMYGLAGQAEFDMLPLAQRRLVGEAYRHNRSRAQGVPGGGLSAGMLRMDWLMGDTSFGGIRENERLVRARCGGELIPCTFELMCVKQYAMSAEEVRAQGQLQRSLEAARERDRAAAREGDGDHCERRGRSEELDDDGYGDGQ